MEMNISKVLETTSIITGSNLEVILREVTNTRYKMFLKSNQRTTFELRLSQLLLLPYKKAEKSRFCRTPPLMAVAKKVEIF